MRDTIEITCDGHGVIYTFDLPMDRDASQRFVDVVEQFRGKVIHMRGMTCDDDWSALDNGDDFRYAINDDDEAFANAYEDTFGDYDDYPDPEHPAVFDLEDEQYAAKTFGELADERDVEEFESWLAGLNGREQWTVMTAMDSLRNIMALRKCRVNLSTVLRSLGSDLKNSN